MKQRTQYVVDLPQLVAETIRRYQQEQRSGSVTLHFKDGRVMEVDELVKGKVVART